MNIFRIMKAFIQISWNTPHYLIDRFILSINGIFERNAKIVILILFFNQIKRILIIILIHSDSSFSFSFLIFLIFSIFLFLFYKFLHMILIFKCTTIKIDFISFILFSFCIITFLFNFIKLIRVRVLYLMILRN